MNATPVQREQDQLLYTYIDSPIGRILLAGTERALVYVGFSSGKRAMGADPAWQRSALPFRLAADQFAEYFTGERKRFNLALEPRVTPFQAQVLKALQQIPYGETRSYKDIAIAIGNPKAVRAVGAANGANPLPLVIPCHRVVGSDGSLTGFGGGMEAKRYLLDLERAGSGLFSL